MRQGLPHKVLAWCCFWLMLAALLPQQPGARLPVAAAGEPGIASSRSDRDQLIRPEPAKIAVRRDLRDAAGSGGAGRKAIVPGKNPWAGLTTIAPVRTPLYNTEPPGFLAVSTRHPRAPPA